MLQFSKRHLRQREKVILLLLTILSIFSLVLLQTTLSVQPVVPSVVAEPSLNPEAMASQFSREPILPIPLAIALDPRKIALGKQLFQDPQLSKTGKMSCASCHDLRQAGTDRLPRSIGNDGKAIDRNAPTVLNSRFNFKQFWDGRAETLEAQIDEAIRNPREMAINWSAAITKLQQDPQYRSAFSTIYANAGIQPDTVKDAIVTFEQSLITPNARFDQFLRGNLKAITPEEKQGYDRFKSYGCVACHQGINVGGNLFQSLGVMKPYYIHPEQFPSDQGRFNLTQNYRDRHVFKVPSLRNVELTAPYLHDGHLKTLEEVVKIMGEYQLGRTIPEEDINLIVKFLRTLTGELPQGLS